MNAREEFSRGLRSTDRTNVTHYDKLWLDNLEKVTSSQPKSKPYLFGLGQGGLGYENGYNFSQSDLYQFRQNYNRKATLPIPWDQVDVNSIDAHRVFNLRSQGDPNGY